MALASPLEWKLLSSQGLIQETVEEGCSSLFEKYENLIISKTRQHDFAIMNKNALIAMSLLAIQLLGSKKNQPYP